MTILMIFLKCFLKCVAPLMCREHPVDRTVVVFFKSVILPTYFMSRLHSSNDVVVPLICREHPVDRTVVVFFN